MTSKKSNACEPMGNHNKNNYSSSSSASNHEFIDFRDSFLSDFMKQSLDD